MIISRGGLDLNELWFNQQRALIESDDTYQALQPLPKYKEQGDDYSVNHGNIRRAGEDGAKELNQRATDAGHPLRVEAKGVGCGGYGCVHKTSDPDRVVKFDSGKESRLARHAIENPEKFKGISSIPRFHHVERTSLGHGGRTVWAIHRENLEDLPVEHEGKWSHFGAALSKAYHLAHGQHRKDMELAEKHGHTVDADKLLHGHMREQVSVKLRAVYKKMFAGTEHEKQFRRVRGDIEKLISHGIVPCDLPDNNWGVRKNGEVVIRDAGCYKTHKPK